MSRFITKLSTEYYNHVDSYFTIELVIREELGAKRTSELINHIEAIQDILKPTIVGSSRGDIDEEEIDVPTFARRKLKEPS